jgi:hypothetical protein
MCNRVEFFLEFILHNCDHLFHAVEQCRAYDALDTHIERLVYIVKKDSRLSHFKRTDTLTLGETMPN